MGESTFRSNVCKSIRNRDPIPVENSAWPGTPDVSYIGGWLELKYAGKFPVGKESWLRRSQVAFMRTHARRGGVAHVLIQVGRGRFYLVPGNIAAELVAPLTEEQLVQASSAMFTSLDELDRLLGENR